LRKLFTFLIVTIILCCLFTPIIHADTATNQSSAPTNLGLATNTNSSSVSSLQAPFSKIDFFHNGTISFNDLLYFVNAYINFYHTGVLDPQCDLNNDGVINFMDLRLFTQYYTEYWQTLNQPTPTPTTNSSASLSDGQWYTDSTWTSCPTQNVYYDYSTTYQGNPTFRIDPGNNFGADHSGIAIVAGDHIVMSCWIKTSGSNPQPNTGARMGIDFYGPNGRIGSAVSPQEAAAGEGYPNTYINEDSYFVHWGIDWTLVTWDFKVPNTFLGDGGFPPYYDGNQVSVGVSSTITWCVPWLQIYGQNGYLNTYTAWFSNFQFYINP
jgi:hypothetical protein